MASLGCGVLPLLLLLMAAAGAKLEDVGRDSGGRANVTRLEQLIDSRKRFGEEVELFDADVDLVGEETAEAEDRQYWSPVSGVAVT